VDDVKWGPHTTDSRQLNSINYYLDDAKRSPVRARTRLRHRTRVGHVCTASKHPLIVSDDQRYLPPSTAGGVDAERWNYFKDHGTSVPNTYVSSPECCPSRASILSGRYPHTL